MEDVKWFSRKCGYLLALLIIILMASCIIFEKENIAEKKKMEKVGESPLEIDKMNYMTKIDIYEKGYKLPITNAQRKESEMDCKAAMEKIQAIYMAADKGKASNAVITKETASSMMENLKETECPVTASSYLFNMCNYEKMEAFLESSLKGKKEEIVIYEIHSNGGVGRRKFIFDGSDIYILETTARWNEENMPVITHTSYSRIKEWEYTKKGWFTFEYCVPEPPEVSEIVNGNVMIRVKPLKEEYYEITEKYLMPIGYQGNNLLCSNWDEKHMEDIDFNGLFQYLYSVKYGEWFDSAKYTNGILKEEFENLIMEYLPVTTKQLETYAVYDAKNQIYEWVQIGCGNYAPNAFGKSVPEISKIQENEDGTVTLTIDTVCEMLGSDAVMSHQLTLQFMEDGDIRYLRNKILDNGLERIPAYQYRFGR